MKVPIRTEIIVFRRVRQHYRQRHNSAMNGQLVRYLLHTEKGPRLFGKFVSRKRYIPCYGGDITRGDRGYG